MCLNGVVFFIKFYKLWTRIKNAINSYTSRKWITKTTPFLLSLLFFPTPPSHTSPPPPTTPLHDPAIVKANQAFYSTCYTERWKTKRKSNRWNNYGGGGVGEASYDDSKKVCSSVIILLVTWQCSTVTRDGILRRQINQTRVFCSMLFTVPYTVGF